MALALGAYDQSTTAYLPSVQCQIYSWCFPVWQPFVTSINMGAFGQTNGVNANFAVYTNACKAYIDKLATFATNSQSKLFISASAGGYANTNLLFDNVRYGFNYPWCDSGGCFPQFGSTISSAVSTLESTNSYGTHITYVDGIEDGSLPSEPPHMTNAVNVASYMSWGAHSLLTAQYATDTQIRWQGSSGWYLIETIESFNGQPGAGVGDFFQWFSSGAFGGTNYSNTPVGAVTHVDEPGFDGINVPATYFGLWISGKNFACCAWVSHVTGELQVVGDPFTIR